MIIDDDQLPAGKIAILQFIEEAPLLNDLLLGEMSEKFPFPETKQLIRDHIEISDKLCAFRQEVESCENEEISAEINSLFKEALKSSMAIMLNMSENLNRASMLMTTESLRNRGLVSEETSQEIMRCLIQ